jgi:carboxylesterase type B
MFWIHGGGFLTGHGSDPTFDGGNLASRGDIVVVTINYRLGALGFLALNDGVTNGNFGFADQIVALDWVREHIRDFGGDPDRITIVGESAGATSVRAMLVSPKAVGKFVGAIPLSYIGGLSWGATFAKYYTVEEAASLFATPALEAANCTNATSQVDCLREIPERDLWWAATNARFLVVDGVYLTSDKPPFPDAPLPIHLMMGITAEDGAPLISYPPDVTAQNTSWLTSQGLPDPSPDFFPIADISNATLAIYQMGSRLATDAMFRCVGQATAYAALQTEVFGSEIFYYEFERTYQIPEWPQLDLCEAPRTASQPKGDPKSPDNNFRCHTGGLLYVFGNIARRGLPHRDKSDLLLERYVLDAFASFVRTYDPNPTDEFLTARGYESTLEILKETGPWLPAVRNGMLMRALDHPVEGDMMKPFKDIEQCEWMGLPLDSFLTVRDVGADDTDGRLVLSHKLAARKHKG